MALTTLKQIANETSIMTLMNKLHVLVVLVVSVFTIGCSGLSEYNVSSPQAALFTGPGLVAQRFVKYKEEIHQKAEACAAEEEDLTKQSIKAISESTTPNAINVYRQISQNGNHSDAMRAEALYQVGLIHMNRYNDRRNDGEAVKAFNQILTQFPDLQRCDDVREKIALVNERKEVAIHYTSANLAKIRSEMQRRASACMAEEPDLLPESARAISEGKTEPLIKGLLHIYLDSQEDQEVRARALYQVGLVYMNTHNPTRNDNKALSYFRLIKQDFPYADICDGLDEKISDIKQRLDNGKGI